MAGEILPDNQSDVKPFVSKGVVLPEADRSQRVSEGTLMLDHDLKAIWRAHAAGQIDDAQAQAAHEAIQALRKGRGGNTAEPPRVPTGLRRASCRVRREKVFGPGRCRPMDRNAKARLMHLARALMRRTEPGRAYGVVTAKAIAVRGPVTAKLCVLAIWRVCHLLSKVDATQPPSARGRAAVPCRGRTRRRD